MPSISERYTMESNKLGLSLLTVFLAQILVFQPSHQLPSTIRIGALFTGTTERNENLTPAVFPICTPNLFFSDDQKDSPTELAFKYAVYKINKEKTILPNNTLAYDIQYVPPEDSFRTTKKVIKQLVKMKGFIILFVFFIPLRRFAVRLSTVCWLFSAPRTSYWVPTYRASAMP